VDIEMMTSTYVNHLKELVEEKLVDESLIDEAVLRILQLKQKLGLFENPYRGANVELESEVVMSTTHREAARELAAKSSVLLKNESTLPLKREQKIALIGPFAENGDILGPWSWLGSKEDAVTVKEGLLTKIKDSHLTVSKGCDTENITDAQLEEALKAAREADVIVLALGEDSEMSGEAGCRANIQLPAAQLQLIEHLKSLDKPMAAVLFNGRPLDLHGVLDQTDAVLEAWYPGTEGGAAIADLLFGDVNPSGRLTMSFPYHVGQVPVYYNRFNTGRPKGAPDAQERYVSQYLDIPNDPLLPFGFGLSYTSFTYSEMKLSNETMTEEQSLDVSIQVTNDGPVAGEEVVQLYIRDHSGEVIRPVKELKDFKKISLEPGETADVSFTISEDQLRYHHSDLQYKSDSGTFTVYIGRNSKDVMEQTFKLEK
jgi:beta-glucosidase